MNFSKILAALSAAAFALSTISIVTENEVSALTTGEAGIAFQTNSTWNFRNVYGETSSATSDGSYAAFPNEIVGVVGGAAGYGNGNFTDIPIEGDGSYSVSMYTEGSIDIDYEENDYGTGGTWSILQNTNPDGSAGTTTDKFNMLLITTDIECTYEDGVPYVDGEEVTVSDLSVDMCGTGYTADTVYYKDDLDYLTISVINAYGNSSIDASALPTEDGFITINFTISGLGTMVDDGNSTAYDDGDDSTSDSDDTEYNTENTIYSSDNEEYSTYSDWGSMLLVGYTELEKAEDGMRVTVYFDILDGYEYYLIAPCNVNGTSVIYNAETNADSITGVTKDTDDGFSTDTFDGEYYLQNDGFFVITDTSINSLTFTLSQDALDALIADAYSETLSSTLTTLGDDTESDYFGGLVFQVYGVDVTSALLEYNTLESSDDDTDDTDDTDDEDSSEEDSSYDSSDTSSTSSTTSTTSDTNPSTGAAAFGAVGIVFAAAAFIVSKRK